MQRIRRHLSYANIAATLALCLALAGGTVAVAGSKIGAQDIKKIKVRTAQALGPTGQPLSASATCRAGEKMTGGGGGESSAPQGNGWIVTNPQGSIVNAYALCLTR